MVDDMADALWVPVGNEYPREGCPIGNFIHGGFLAPNYRFRARSPMLGTSPSLSAFKAW